MSKNISNLHLEILDKNRQELLQKLTPYLEGFVLAGGTALALQLKHRKSFDFDFFSESSIPKRLLEQLSNVVAIKNTVINNEDELTFFTKEDIKITFLYYPFKPNSQPIEKDGLRIFSLSEIALQKAYTIGRRGEYRDYFDMYTILKDGGVSLSEIIAGAKQVYNGSFDEKLFLEQLVYFGDISNFEVISVGKQKLTTRSEIELYFQDLTNEYLQNQT